jgi:pimeloyl-ACP methyl ester carboxylesterase
MPIEADGRRSLPTNRYNSLRERVGSVETLRTPALMIQGASDMCDPPSESEDQERYFSGGHRRVLLDGVGHFPAREAPNEVGSEVLSHLKEFA